MGHTRTQRLARQIQHEQGISYTRALGLARQQIDEEYASRETAQVLAPAAGTPAEPATTLVFLSPADGGTRS